MERATSNFPALTQEEARLLATKRILVVGCGGLGGYLVELLARLGVGALRCVDGDVFESSNLNRQLLSDPTVLGRSKALVAADWVARVNPRVQVEAISEYFTRDNAARLLSGCDAVVDGLDSIRDRKLLARACSRAGLPYVFGAISGWVAQWGILLPGDRLLDRLYPTAQAEPQGTLSFTPALCAALQCALCTKLLTGRPVETGTIHYVDLLHNDCQTLPL